MLGFPSQPRAAQERRNNKKLELIIQNLETTIEILKEELELDKENNTIKLDELLYNLDKEFPEPQYAEEED